MRPANIITSMADIIAGFAISGAPLLLQNAAQSQHLIGGLILLLIATIGLYGGGVVFNDFFDAKLDQVERPERPLPKGIISLTQAAIFGAILFVIGIVSASFVSLLSGLIAFFICVLCICYDKYTKHHLWLGPVNMGLCRGMNLLLGISIINSALGQYWSLMFIPLLFIAAITLISKGEVHGSNKNLLWISMIIYAVTVILLLNLNIIPNFKFLNVLPLIVLFAGLIFYSLYMAIKTMQPAQIRKAVKMGIISLIILDAIFAIGFASWFWGILVLLLLPISILLAKKFAVT